MSEKEKPKRGSKMSLLRSCLIFSLYPLLIFTICGCGFVYWANGGFVKPFLDPDYIPTAEYLLENPITIRETETPQDVLGVGLDITQPFGQICFIVSSEGGSTFDDLGFSEVLINEELLKPNFLFMDVITSMPGAAFPCVYGFLFSGLHIIEFRLKESSSSEPYYIHRWAIEIP